MDMKLIFCVGERRGKGGVSMGKKLFVLFALFLSAAAVFAAGQVEDVDPNLKVHGVPISDIQSGDVLKGWYVSDVNEIGLSMYRYEYDKKNKQLIEYSAMIMPASSYYMVEGLSNMLGFGEPILPDRDGYVYEGLEYSPIPLHPYGTAEEKMLDDKHIYVVESLILSYDGSIPKHLKVIDADGDIRFEGKVEKSK